MIILSRGGDEFRRVAERIADEEGCETESDLDTALERDDQIVLVTDPESVSERNLIALQERLSERGPIDGGFSLITGRTAHEAAALYERGDRHEGDVVALQRDTPSGQRFDDDVTVLTGNDASATELGQLGHDGAHSLTLHSNGWPIHLNLSDGFLCGFPSNPSEWDFSGEQPYCVADGEMDCPLSEGVVKADALSFDHVFVESCSSAIANSTSGLPVHVVLALMNGASSLIGAYRPGPTQFQEIVLYHSLLRSGYSLTECCYLLNENATVNDIMTHPYVSFGHPETSSDRATDPSYEVTIDGRVLEIAGATGHVMDVTLDRGALPNADRYYVEDLRDTDEVLYYTAFEEDDDLRVLLYTGRRFDDESISVRIHPSPPKATDADQLVHSFEEGRRTRAMNLATDAFETKLTNLRHQVGNLGQEVSSAKFDAATYADAAAEVERPFGNVDAMEAELSSFAADGDYLYYKYGSVAVDERSYHSDETCHVCDRPVFVKVISDTHGEAERAIGNCPQCGHIYDVPLPAPDSSPTYPVVTGERGIGDGTFRELEVAFTNPHDVSMQAKFVPSVLKIGSRRGDRDLFEPTEERRTLAPGETERVTFELDTRLLYENQHFVLGRVVGNLRLYSGRSILYVGDSTGHLRPNQR